MVGYSFLIISIILKEGKRENFLHFRHLFFQLISTPSCGSSKAEVGFSRRIKCSIKNYCLEQWRIIHSISFITLTSLLVKLILRHRSGYLCRWSDVQKEVYQSGILRLLFHGFFLCRPVFCHFLTLGVLLILSYRCIRCAWRNQVRMSVERSWQPSFLVAERNYICSL